jgi:hypothetical protein
VNLTQWLKGLWEEIQGVLIQPAGPLAGAGSELFSWWD